MVVYITGIFSFERFDGFRFPLKRPEPREKELLAYGW
jgi:hypothetical protein